jgi:hypothetical protein
MYPKEKVDVESLRQLLPEEIPLLSIRVLPPLPGSDPLPASLGGSTPPPSGLSDLRSDAHTSSLPSDSPSLGHHVSAGGGPPA